MNDIKKIFEIENVIEFKESSIIKKQNLKIAVKNYFYNKNELNQSGITYFILDDNYKISSQQLSQSWEALNAWFKVFKKCETIGYYDFENEKIK